MGDRNFFKKIIMVKNKKLKTHSGVIVMTIMIITGLMMTIIALALMTTSTDSSKIRFYQSYSQKIFFNADSCAEEALTRLDRNNNYTGGSMAFDLSDCTISVTGSGNTRTIQIAATNNNEGSLQLNLTRNLQISVNIFPVFSVTGWQEL